MSRKFRLGLLINPVAGIGGSVALKGSDGVVAQALSLGAIPLAIDKTRKALEVLLPYQAELEIVTVSGAMGAELAKEMGFSYQICYQPLHETTSALDTEAAATALAAKGIDVLLFAGGDGTARNICAAVASHTTVLGIPAGCKIHSGVYAISPTAAGQVIAKLIRGELVTLTEAAVMDIDEAAFREGVVKAKRYGEMKIPAELRYVQSVKSGGKELETLVLDDLAAYIALQLEDDVRYVMGSGTTVASVMQELGLENTLLGVDVVENGALLAKDVTAQKLLALVQEKPSKLIITLIGGQGHVFGRGNQQLSPSVIRAVGRENIWIVATKTKLQELAGRPLLADTGDSQLDDELQGVYPVLVGYNDYVMYRLGLEEDVCK